jgi:aminotransferase
MEKYNFDTVIDRRGTSSMKYEGLDAVFGRHDVSPLWIADLDFAVCPDIVKTLRQRLDHPILGYFACPDSYWNAVMSWLERRHGLKTEREQLAFIPGVVKGIGYAVNFFSRPGDRIVIQPPVYHPFRMVIEGNGRQVVENPLVFDGDNYTMDLDGLEEAIIRKKPTMMILCNPHNPIGIQWSAETLARVAAICRSHGVTVVSDEIHGDLVLYGKPHIPFVDVSDDARAVGITLGAPSKTFNIPGLVSSWVLVKDPELRRDFFHWLEVNEFSAPMMISALGAEVAYTHGEQWLDEMVGYVEDNIDFAVNFVDRHIPGVRIIRPQASFLLWVDFRGLGLSQNELMDLLLDKAHIALNDGTMFGAQGLGFARLNVGTPRSVLATALEQIREAVVNMPARVSTPDAINR